MVELLIDMCIYLNKNIFYVKISKNLGSCIHCIKDKWYAMYKIEITVFEHVQTFKDYRFQFSINVKYM